MLIQDFITITENKLRNLNIDLSSHLINGNAELYSKIEIEIDETTKTLNKLNSL